MSTVKNVTTMIVCVSLFTALSLQEVFAWTVNANFDNGGLDTKANGTNAFSEAFAYTFFSQEKQYDGLQSAKMSVDQGTNGFGKWGG